MRVVTDQVWQALAEAYPEQAWPEFIETRHLVSPDSDLHRTQELTMDQLPQMYSAYSMTFVSQLDRVQAPQILNLLQRNRGVRGQDEELPPKRQRQLTDPVSFVSESSQAAQAGGSTSSSGTFRWDATWQRHRPEGDRLHSRLMGVSWNHGGNRQAMDTTVFLCGTFAYIAVQEAADAEAELLRARGMNVVVGDDSSVLVARKSAFTTGPGDLVGQLLRELKKTGSSGLCSDVFSSTYPTSQRVPTGRTFHSSFWEVCM